MSRFLLALSQVAALATAASANTVTVTLDAGTIPDKVVCLETWMEGGVGLSFVETTPDDCGAGSCYFAVEGDGVNIWPARLNLDVGGLAGQILSAEADVNDNCGVNCTRLLLYSGAMLVAAIGNTDGAPETLTASAGGTAVDRVAVSSCEGNVAEIRIRIESACPWDCADGNGTVDVVDFLSLLAQWGQVGTPCDLGQGPAGIDVTDFLQLLAHWGPCP